MIFSDGRSQCSFWISSKDDESSSSATTVIIRQQRQGRAQQRLCVFRSSGCFLFQTTLVPTTYCMYLSHFRLQVPVGIGTLRTRIIPDSTDQDLNDLFFRALRLKVRGGYAGELVFLPFIREQITHHSNSLKTQNAYSSFVITYHTGLYCY